MADNRLLTDKTGQDIVRMLGAIVAGDIEATQNLHEIHNVVKTVLLRRCFLLEIS